MNIWVIARLTFKEAIYDKVLYGLFICFAFIMLGSSFAGELALLESYRVVIDLSFTAMSVLGEFLALFYGCFALFKEIERKTLYTLLSKGVLRYQLILGKFVGINLLLLLIVSLTTLLLYAVIYLNLDPRFPNTLLNWNIPKAVMLLSLELMLLTAMSLFFSVITSSPIHCLFFTCTIFVLGLYNDILRSSPQVAFFGHIKLNAVTALVRTLSYILPNFQCFDISQQANGLIMVPWGYIWTTALYGGLYTGIFLLAAMMIFSRRVFA